MPVPCSLRYWGGLYCARVNVESKLLQTTSVLLLTGVVGMTRREETYPLAAVRSKVLIPL